ncbi:MAG: hypothetical protein ACLUPK_03740 [Veillonella sp.]
MMVHRPLGAIKSTVFLPLLYLVIAALFAAIGGYVYRIFVRQYEILYGVCSL